MQKAKLPPLQMNQHAWSPVTAYNWTWNIHDPDLTQTLELCTLFTIAFLITPLIVPKYLRLMKLVKDMPDSVGMTFSSLLQLLNQVRPCLQLAHYMTDLTVKCSAAFSKITSLSLSYTSHAIKVQCAACSHATCRCVWGCCKFVVYIIRHWGPKWYSG